MINNNRPLKKEPRVKVKVKMTPTQAQLLGIK